MMRFRVCEISYKTVLLAWLFSRQKNSDKINTTRKIKLRELSTWSCWILPLVWGGSDGSTIYRAQFGELFQWPEKMQIITRGGQTRRPTNRPTTGGVTSRHVTRAETCGILAFASCETIKLLEITKEHRGYVLLCHWFTIACRTS